MTGEPVEDDFFERLGRIEGLLERLESQVDPGAREGARELLGTVLELHARGLARLLELLDPKHDLRAIAAAEPALSGLLALHGLHPTPVGERVRRVLDELAPKLAPTGGRVELVALELDLVKVRLHGSGSLRELVAETLGAAVPDARELVIEVAAPEPHLVPLRLGRERAAELGAK